MGWGDTPSWTIFIWGVLVGLWIGMAWIAIALPWLDSWIEKKRKQRR